MATNIRQVDNSIILLQCGNGIPSHICLKPTLYVDNDTATFYVNKNGVAVWDALLDASTPITGGTSTGGVSITGVTFTNNNLVLTNSTGGTVSVSINTFTGLTATTISATTYYGDGSHLTGVSGSGGPTVTGGTYSNGTAIFTNSTGGTFSVTGFTTGVTSTDTYLTGGTANNASKQYIFTNNTGGTFTVNALTDITVTGGTYSNGTTIFTNTTGGTFSVTGFSTAISSAVVTGGTPDNANKIYTFTNSTGGTFNVVGLTDIGVTGSSFSNNNLTLTNNTGGTITTLINNLSGLTINGLLTLSGNNSSEVLITSSGRTVDSVPYNELFTTDATLNAALQASSAWTGTPPIFISSTTGATAGYQGQYFIGSIGTIPYLFMCKSDGVWVRMSLTDVCALVEGGTGSNLSGTTASGVIIMNASQTGLGNSGFLINQSLQTTNAVTFNSLTSTLRIITGGFAPAITAAKTAAYTAVATTDNTIPVDATVSAITVTLPTAVGNSGQEFVIKKIDSTANIVTVATTSSQTIDGATGKTLTTQWQYTKVKSNNANWYVIG